MGRAQPSLTLYPAGALRRFEPTVGDLLVLAAGDEPRAAVAAWADSLPAADVRWRSRDAVTFLWDGEEITLRAVADDRARRRAACTTPARASTWRSSPGAPACAACG